MTISTSTWVTTYGLRLKIAARYHALRAANASARLILACIRVLRRLADALGMTLAEAAS